MNSEVPRKAEIGSQKEIGRAKHAVLLGTWEDNERPSSTERWRSLAMKIDQTV